MARQQDAQSKHDKEVLRLADMFVECKFHSVRADKILGYHQPPLIDGMRPDIEAGRVNAEREWEIVIVEVETYDTVDSAHAQIQKTTFENYAAQHENVEFRLYVV